MNVRLRVALSAALLTCAAPLWAQTPTAEPNIYDRLAAMSDDQLMGLIASCDMATQAEANHDSALGVARIDHYSADRYQGEAFASGVYPDDLQSNEERLHAFRQRKVDQVGPHDTADAFLNTRYPYLIYHDIPFMGITREVKTYHCRIGDDFKVEAW